MCVVAKFTVPGKYCVITRAMAKSNDVEIELDRVVPLGGTIAPMLWVRGAPEAVDGFVEGLADQPAVERVTPLEPDGERALYKFEWADHPDGVVGHLLETDAAVLSAAGTAESLDFSIRFNTADALSDFHSRCRESGISLEVTGVRQNQEAEDRGPGLTSHQRETLLRAYEAGYYDVPREVTAVDLAEEMGISDQSLSERLRRAHARLVEHSLL